MSAPPGPTIATATLQLFFAASASAGAAAFLAFSRLMAVPYGFGICANALANAPSANITPITNLTITFCDILSPSDSIVFRSLDLRRPNKIGRVVRIARASILRNLRIGTERPCHLHARGNASALVLRRNDHITRSPLLHPLFERRLNVVLRIPRVGH